jgi:hypothetical protein
VKWQQFPQIEYAKLNSRQQENYNFQRVSAVLAEYGFSTLRLSDDWQGADFIALHIDGTTFFRVQLKGRLTIDKKYKNKELWICFSSDGVWYLYPHDTFLCWVENHSSAIQSKSWIGDSESAESESDAGSYTWPVLSKQLKTWLNDYQLN